MALQRWRTWAGLTGINAIIDAVNNISGASLLSGSVINAALSSMVQATIKGRAAGAGTGVPQDLTANQVSTILDAASDPFVRTSAAAAVGERGRVRAATTVNITISTALNNGDTLDGVTLVTGDLVLVKNQSSAAENGVYVVGTSPARSGQYDAYDEHPGVLLTVMEGTTNADTLWLCTSNKGGTLNSTSLAFAQLVSAAPSGLVLLASLSASSSASLAFTTRNAAGQSGAIFQSDYDAYRVLLVNVVPATNGVNLTMEYSSDGGSTWVTTGYSRAYHFAGSQVAHGISSSEADAGVLIADTISNTTADGGVSGEGLLWNPLSTAHDKRSQFDANMHQSTDAHWYRLSSMHNLASTTAMNAIRFLFSSGNIATGKILIYGFAQ